jgi:voltage-gated potassium channel
MLLVTWFRMLRTMVRGVREDPEFRALAGAVGSLLVVGTVFYALNQDWSLVDSFYFSVTTLTTVGFGDLAPEGDGAKLATVAYELSGVGLLVLFLSQLTQRGMREREEKRGRRSGSA